LQIEDNILSEMVKEAPREFLVFLHPTNLPGVLAPLGDKYTPFKVYYKNLEPRRISELLFLRTNESAYSVTYKVTENSSRARGANLHETRQENMPCLFFEQAEGPERGGARRITCANPRGETKVRTQWGKSFSTPHPSISGALSG
jgi:hypothetical protein